MTREDIKERIAARLKRLPRAFYWIAGAIIACAGALGARFISEAFPLQERVPIWLAGAGVVFIGLCVLSLGTRNFLEAGGEEQEASVGETPQPAGDAAANEESKRTAGETEKAPEAAGAGEGNRTLA